MYNANKPNVAIMMAALTGTGNQTLCPSGYLFKSLFWANSNCFVGKEGGCKSCML